MDDQNCIEFNWERDPATADGVEPTFKLYENGELIAEDIAPARFTLLMTGKDPGDYEYRVREVKGEMESELSEPVTVNFTQPNPPTNLTARWIKCHEISVSGAVG